MTHVLEQQQTSETGSDSKHMIEPLLRWAGGKRWFLPTFKLLTEGRSFRRYHEPFLGGGSVFLGTALTGQAFLSDSNTDLIEAYVGVRKDPDGVHGLLRGYSNDAETYYRVRSIQPKTRTELAARFLFLNHTSFNGIHRVNSAGRYNVPFGRRNSVNLPSLEELRQAAEKLRGANLEAKDFAEALSLVERDDLVFLDPPYAIETPSDGFVRYNANAYSFDDQKRLLCSLTQLVEKGAYFAMTNSADDSVRRLFSELGPALELRRRSSVGGKKARRGQITELLFTNIVGGGALGRLNENGGAYGIDTDDIANR